MSRPAVAAVLLFLLPRTAVADAGSPGPVVRTIWIDCTFTVDQDYPAYEFYLLPGIDLQPSEQVLPERLPITLSNPVRVSGSGEQYRYWPCPIYAVPKSLLAELGNKPPSRDWIFANSRRVQVVDYTIYFRKGVWFTDNRERAEITYRIEKDEKEPNGWRLVKVSESEGNPWVRRGWVAVGVLLAVGFVVLGFRSVRRLFWPRPDPPKPDQRPWPPSPTDPNSSPP